MKPFNFVFMGLLIGLAVSACDSGQAPIDTNIPIDADIPAERIASAYHGMLLDKDLKEIDLDFSSVAEMQDSMINELMKESDEEIRKSVGLAIDKLLGAEKLDIAEQTVMKNGIIGQLLTYAPESLQANYEWRYRLIRSWSATLQVRPEILELMQLWQLPFDDVVLKGGSVDYIAECAAEFVPIPPDWPSEEWGRGVALDPEYNFVGNSQTMVHTYANANGVCFALPRQPPPENPNRPPLMGIICQSERTGKACFWDNIDATTGRRIDWRNSRAVIANLQNGRNLAENCTNCHRGWNVFLIHPGSALATTGRDTDPVNRYSPIGQTHWSNPITLTLAARGGEACADCQLSCVECHMIPEPRSNTRRGYCDLLRQAVTPRGGGTNMDGKGTMPPQQSPLVERYGPPPGWPAPSSSRYYQDIQFLMGTCALEPIAQSTLAFTWPDRDGAVLTELPTIMGTVSTPLLEPPETVTQVRIAIGMQEADEEWAYDSTRRIYRWITGPTGQWLSTQLVGNTWSAPSTAYSLPSGSDLPNGNYVIYAYLETDRGARSEQISRTFTIRR